MIGRAFFFVRLNKEKAITTRNLADMLFNQIDATRNGVLGGVAELMKVYFQPALRKQTNWGELSKMGRAGQNKINQFLESVTRFTDCLENAQKSIEGAFKLQVKISVSEFRRKVFTSKL